MKSYRFSGLLVPVFFLNACASPPVHYYSLLAPSGETITTKPPAPFMVDVLPVGIPSQNDQSQLVVRQAPLVPLSLITSAGLARWMTKFVVPYRQY